MNGNFWQTKWKLYKRVHELLLSVNARIDFLLLLSYATNLYFICVQLLACMRLVFGEGCETMNIVAYRRI